MRVFKRTSTSDMKQSASQRGMSAVSLNQSSAGEKQRASPPHRASACEAEGSAACIAKDAPIDEPPLSSPLCEQMSFDRWSERMQQLLRDKGLAGTIMRYVSQRLPGRTGVIITPEQSAQGATLIWCNAGEELRKAVSWKGTTLEVWGALHEYSRNKWALADNDVRGLTQSPVESLSNYLTRAYNLREVTVQHGVKDERRLVKATLRGLRPEFGHLRPLLRNPGATLADFCRS